MITTKQFQLTSNDFFKILVTAFFRKNWWIFALIWSIAIMSLFFGNRDSFQNFFIFFAIVYPLAIVIMIWRSVIAKDNRLFLMERYFEIYEDKIIGILIDGSTSTTNNERFIKEMQLKRYYLLYIAKNQFYYIPKAAFKSDQDIEWFEKEIILKIKK